MRTQLNANAIHELAYLARWMTNTRMDTMCTSHGRLPAKDPCHALHPWAHACLGGTKGNRGPNSFPICGYDWGVFRGYKNWEVFRRVIGEYFLKINFLNFDLGRILGELLEMLLVSMINFSWIFIIIFQWRKVTWHEVMWRACMLREFTIKVTWYEVMWHACMLRD
jgi:hypothetical protein